MIEGSLLQGPSPDAPELMRQNLLVCTPYWEKASEERRGYRSTFSAMCGY
jgi:hypothetical protein